MARNEDHLKEKFSQAYEKCEDDSIIPVFYKSENDKEKELYYVWKFNGLNEILLIKANTVFAGSFEDQEEIIADDDDYIAFTLGEFYSNEGDHNQLENILDQCIQNKSRTFKFVHINWENAERDGESGRSLYIISLDDVIDAQKPFDKVAFDASMKAYKEELANEPEILKHFRAREFEVRDKNADLYMTLVWTLKAHEMNKSASIRYLESILWHWENDPNYTVDKERIEMMKRVIKELKEYGEE